MIWPFNSTPHPQEVTVLTGVTDGSLAPWVAFPDYLPYDGFWHRTGEAPLFAWRSMWNAMDPAEQKAYCIEHAAPEAWQEWLYRCGHHANDD